MWVVPSEHCTWFSCNIGLPLLLAKQPSESTDPLSFEKLTKLEPGAVVYSLYFICQIISCPCCILHLELKTLNYHVTKREHKPLKHYFLSNLRNQPGYKVGFWIPWFFLNGSKKHFDWFWYVTAVKGSLIFICSFFLLWTIIDMPKNKYPMNKLRNTYIFS